MRKNKTKGFTLIELLIVIAIIAILAAVLIPNVVSAPTTVPPSPTCVRLPPTLRATWPPIPPTL